MGKGDDITLGELKRVSRLLDMLNDAAMQHAVAIYIDGIANHSCGLGDLSEDEMDDAPEFDEKDVEMLLAIEHASLANFKVIRIAMRAQGYPVDETVPDYT